MIPIDGKNEILLPPNCALKYQPIRKLSQGGFGAVILANQVTLNRPVALKLLLPRLATNPITVQRFLSEARITASLVHPSIVRLIDHDVEDGIPWVAYEYLPGQPLNAVFSAGPLPWRSVLEMGVQIASALEEAHARGVIHRDIKPSNILEVERGTYKLIDFGLAWSMFSSLALTETGCVLGTPAYMSPEQLRGFEVTASSDLYSLAVVLYECLTGRRPHEATQLFDLVRLQASRPIPRPSTLVKDLPPGLDPLFEQALEYEVKDRFESGTALLQALKKEAGQSVGVSLPITLPGGSGPATAAPRAAPAPASPPTSLIQRLVSRRLAYRWLSVLTVIGVVILLILQGIARGPEPAPDRTGSPGPASASPPVEPRPAGSGRSAGVEATPSPGRSRGPSASPGPAASPSGPLPELVRYEADLARLARLWGRRSKERQSIVRNLFPPGQASFQSFSLARKHLKLMQEELDTASRILDGLSRVSPRSGAEVGQKLHLVARALADVCVRRLRLQILQQVAALEAEVKPQPTAWSADLVHVVRKIDDLRFDPSEIESVTRFVSAAAEALTELVRDRGDQSFRLGAVLVDIRWMGLQFRATNWRGMDRKVLDDRVLRLLDQKLAGAGNDGRLLANLAKGFWLLGEEGYGLRARATLPGVLADLDLLAERFPLAAPGIDKARSDALSDRPKRPAPSASPRLSSPRPSPGPRPGRASPGK